MNIFLSTVRFARRLFLRTMSSYSAHQPAPILFFANLIVHWIIYEYCRIRIQNIEDRMLRQKLNLSWSSARKFKEQKRLHPPLENKYPNLKTKVDKSHKNIVCAL